MESQLEHAQTAVLGWSGLLECWVQIDLDLHLLLQQSKFGASMRAILEATAGRAADEVVSLQSRLDELRDIERRMSSGILLPSLGGGFTPPRATH